MTGDEVVSVPKVSVVCAWYNRADYVQATVDSLLGQDFDSFEVIIINDGSPDPRVREILDSYSDPRLKVIHQENTGFTVAIRRAIDESRGDLIAIMGAGDIALSTRLTAQVDYMNAHPAVGACGTGHVLLSADNNRELGYKSPQHVTSADMLRSKVPFTHGTLMFRRSVYEAVGGYDPFFRSSQDRDLYGRLIQITAIHGIDENHYTKLMFADGVSYAPRLIVQRRFYSSLAAAQDRDAIDAYKSGVAEMPDFSDVSNPRFLLVSIRRLIAALVRMQWSLGSEWFRLVVSQAKRLVVAR